MGAGKGTRGGPVEARTAASDSRHGPAAKKGLEISEHQQGHAAKDGCHADGEPCRESDVPVEPGITGLIDHAHPALAELANNAIRPKGGARLERHRTDKCIAEPSLAPKAFKQAGTARSSPIHPL